MSLYARALGAFTRALANGATYAPPAAPSLVGKRVAVAAERGPGRVVRPREGPSYDRLVAAARADPHAEAALNDVLAGKTSVTQALTGIGLKRPRDRRAELSSVWKRATDEERRDFLREIGAVFVGERRAA